MGNRAKRVELARLLKEKGVPSRLYKGNRNITRKKLRSRDLDNMTDTLNFYSLGAVVSDCDGYNHRIAGWVNMKETVSINGKMCFASTTTPKSKIFQYEFNTWYGAGRRSPKRERNEKMRGPNYGYWLQLPRVSYVDGSLSCGCSASPGCPETREEIEGGTLEHYKNNPEEFQQLDENSRSFKIYCWLKAGGHICDEDGIMLPEWKINHG
jgi:hypothetical protein